MSDQPVARATQHTKTRTNIPALSRIWTHDLSVQAIKAYVLDGTATGTGFVLNLGVKKKIKGKSATCHLLDKHFTLFNVPKRIYYQHDQTQDPE
jgi:hypothetical protein